jgi:putative ABC transport system ATP-binding protein
MPRRLRRYPTQLSSGEHQSVTIARVLIAEPKLIPADEPTGNLDEKNGNEIAQLCRTIIAVGVVLVLIKHNEALTKDADRAPRMRDGRIETSL